MAIKSLNLNLDIYKKTYQPVTEFYQFDKGIPLIVNIYENGVAKDISDCLAVVNVRKPDNTYVVIGEVAVANNSVTCTLTDQVFTRAGTIKVIVDLKKELERVSLFEVSVTINKAIITDEDIESADEHGILIAMVDKVDYVVRNEAVRIANEEQRELNEVNRQTRFNEFIENSTTIHGNQMAVFESNHQDQMREFDETFNQNMDKHDAIIGGINGRLTNVEAGVSENNQSISDLTTKVTRAYSPENKPLVNDVDGLSQALANVYSPENKPTAADIGALSTGGGTVTGFTNFTKGITLPNNAHNPNANIYSIELPNGYKMAWGAVHISGGQGVSGSTRVTLPARFASVKYHVQLTPNGNSGESTVIERLGYHSKYSDNFQIGWVKGNANYGVNVDFLAIGY